MPAAAVKLALTPVVTVCVGGEQVGAGGGATLTVTEAVAVPLTLVQVKVKVVVDIRLPVGWVPLVATDVPFRVQVSAFVEVQVKSVDVLYGILVLAAVMETVGTGGAMTVIVIPVVGEQISGNGVRGFDVPATTKNDPEYDRGSPAPNRSSRFTVVVKELLGVLKFVGKRLLSYLIT